MWHPFPPKMNGWEDGEGTEWEMLAGEFEIHPSLKLLRLRNTGLEKVNT